MVAIRLAGDDGLASAHALRWRVAHFAALLAVFIQASSAMTITVAAWAMHTSRAVLAKASFSSASTSDAGTNMTGPSAQIKKSVGDILPLLRIQNPA